MADPLSPVDPSEDFGSYSKGSESRWDKIWFPCEQDQPAGAGAGGVWGQGWSKETREASRRGRWPEPAGLGAGGERESGGAGRTRRWGEAERGRKEGGRGPGVGRRAASAAMNGEGQGCGVT